MSGLSKFKTQRVNANKHTERGIAALDNSIRADGWIGALTVAADGETFDGSARLEALADAMPSAEPIIVESDGTRPVIVRRTDIPNTDDPRAKRLGIAANVIAHMDYAPDGEILAMIAADDDAVMRLIRQDDASEEAVKAALANGLLGDADAEPQIDRAAELNEKWQVKTGDLWRIGEHRLLCGDSTKREDVERVMQGEKAQMIFTDPPYGVGYDGGAKKREQLEGDHIGTEIYGQAIPLIAEYADDNAPLYLWYADGHAAAAAAAAAAAGYIISAQIIWAKNNAQFVTSAHYKGKHEPCYYAHKKGKSARWHGPNNEVTLWEYDRSSSNDFHPTQKPIELSRRAICNSTEDGNIVLDAFGGSGATMVSCENTHRKARMIELIARYCAVILERMSTAFPDIVIERLS